MFVIFCFICTLGKNIDDLLSPEYLSSIFLSPHHRKRRLERGLEWYIQGNKTRNEDKDRVEAAKTLLEFAHQTDLYNSVCVAIQTYLTLMDLAALGDD